MKIQSYKKDISTAQINPLRATANTSQEQSQAELGQALGNVGQATGQVSDVFEQIQVKKNQYDLNVNMQERQAEFDELMNLMRYDKSITNFDEAFEVKSKEIYQKGRETLSLPGMQRDYDMAFEQAKQSYLNQVRAVSAERTMSDGALAGQTMMENMLSRVGTTGESVRAYLGEATAFLADSPFYSPEQKNQMLADYNAKAVDAAMTGRIQGAFYSAEGDYLAKGDAAHAALLSQDIGQLSAAQQEKYYSMINSLVTREHTAQGWREKESDDQDYEGFNELFMYGTRTGDFWAAKQYCHDADTFNESLPITWLKMIEAEEERRKTRTTSYSIPEPVYDGLVEIAMNTEKDEAWKHRESIAYMTDMGVLPSAFDTGLNYVNGLSKNFQNPIFDMGRKELASYFEPLIEDGKKHDGMEGQELQFFYNRRIMAWDELLRTGNYSAEQMPQVITNFMDETKKLAIEMEFEMKNGINSPADLHPENLDRIKNLPDMIQMAQDGRLLAVRGDYGDLPAEYENFYDTAMGKVIDQGAIPGLQRIGGQYLSDATPRYLAEVNGATVDVRMMPDGSMQYWMDYGNGSGEWSALEYDFINPLEAEALQPKVQLVDTPENPERPVKDYLNPLNNSEPEGFPWAPPAPGTYLANPYNKMQSTPVMHDALREEIKTELESGDLNVFGQIRNKTRNDWMDRYNLNPSELRDMIRAVKEGE